MSKLSCATFHVSVEGAIPKLCNTVLAGCLVFPFFTADYIAVCPTCSMFVASGPQAPHVAISSIVECCANAGVWLPCSPRTRCAWYDLCATCKRCCAFEDKVVHGPFDSCITRGGRSENLPPVFEFPEILSTRCMVP